MHAEGLLYDRDREIAKPQPAGGHSQGLNREGRAPVQLQHTIASPTIVDAAAALRSGTLTPVELVRNCLDQIARLEPEIHAWVHVDEAAALKTAAERSEEARAGHFRSLLHGIPIAVKDIIDVAGLPTRAGSQVTSDRPSERDATVVSRLREAGAIILGKTVTTEFACFDPPPTKNPWNAEHTPGGSSSGSAAAVALGMCPGALASQTGGSITRPATYCGVAGFKPTLGRVSRAGVVPVSERLDHVGTMARTELDAAILLAAISGPDPRDPHCSSRPAIELPRNLAEATPRRPRLGVWREYFLSSAEAETAALVEHAIGRLREGGAEIVGLPLPAGFADVHVMHRRIMARDAACYHRERYGAPRAGYAPKMAGLIDEGLAISEREYEQAISHQEAFRATLDAMLSEVDVVVTPATPGPAPADLTTTGDPRFNSPFSHAGVPTLSVPLALAESGLPIGLQFVGRMWNEVPLAITAMWCKDRTEDEAQD